MKTRVISALIAIVLLAGVTLFFRSKGIAYLGVGAVLLMCFEYARLTLGRMETPSHIQLTFGALSIVTCALLVWGNLALAFGFASVSTVILIAMILATVRTNEELPYILQMQALTVMGLSYCGVFPGFAIRLLALDQGEIWFFGLLAIVFSGDTFAYLAGRAFGRNKLLEPVSPKKTREGSIGGLIGSGLAGLVLGLVFLKSYPIVLMVLMALLTGAFAQAGDLFESLLKRVATVKDSGRIMPGHGGLLDRLDGVLFAAPIYYALVAFLLS